jgi:hypothetical protein
MIAELVETESPNRWRLSVECTDLAEPLRRAVASAREEIQDSMISEVRYSHHEEHTRATSFGIWQAPVHVVQGGAEHELMQAATLVWDMGIQTAVLMRG